MADGFDWQEIAAPAGLLTAATAVLSWITGRKLQRSAIVRSDAEAEKLRLDADRLRSLSAAEFAAAVNEQTRLIFEEQNKRIAELTAEVRLLRGKVETLTRDNEVIHLLRAQAETLTEDLRRARSCQGLRSFAPLPPVPDA